MTYNFLVHSTDIVCRKGGRLGTDPVLLKPFQTTTTTAGEAEVEKETDGIRENSTSTKRQTICITGNWNKTVIITPFLRSNHQERQGTPP